MTLNKSFKILALALALGTVSANTMAANTVSQGETVLDATAAVVNNGIVLESELNDETNKLLAQYKARGANVDPITARKQALQTLITNSIILQIARNNGAEVTDMQLDSTLENAAMRNNTSVDNILRSMGPNLTKAQAREKFKEQYLINEVRRSSVRQRINISDTEVTTLAKALQHRGNVEPMYHIAQILIPLSSTPTEAEYRRVEQESKNALYALRNGANVQEVAAKFATSEQNADLGYVPETAVPLPFLPGILNAKPGDVIGPFRSSVGMHIIKLFDVSHSAISPIKTYNASHILVKTSIIYSDEAAVAKLNDIAQQIKSGAITFEQAAKKYSEDPGSAIRGGNLGYAAAETYDPGFAQGLQSLRVGQLSQPIKSSYGWHLILLNDIKVDRDSLDAYKEKANSILFEREFSEAVVNWERSMREMAYIHVIDPILVNNGVKLDSDNKETLKEKPQYDDADSQRYSEDAVMRN
ncbi:MAG: peptidylprolyl isomerase [Succinivibrio sp.]|jgi:peptidyl-prolyl cis-trans isomerase SurA|nr:peptidylprolyl isomerase [Succinivibrio sp.]